MAGFLKSYEVLLHQSYFMLQICGQLSVALLEIQTQLTMLELLIGILNIPTNLFHHQTALMHRQCFCVKTARVVATRFR